MNAPLEQPSHRQTSPQGWTAAQLAIAGRFSKRWVLRKLAGLTASGSLIVQGNETAIYSFDILPSAIQTAIAANAGTMGVSVAECIETSCKPWQPARPLSELDAASIDDAKRLRAALLPSLQRQSSKLLSSGEKARMALKDYKSEIGHEISVRHWQRLIERTLRRAGISEDFERLELYLADYPKAKMEAQRLTPGENEFADLFSLINGCADLNEPTDGEKAAIWEAAFEIFDESAEGKRKHLRRSLVKFLFRHVPALAGNEHTLHVMFNQKFARWTANGKAVTALQDGRKEKAGVPTAEPFTKADIDKIVWHSSANCGGRVAQAVRDLAGSGARSGLSQETLNIISRPAASKSYVNRRLMEKVSNPVKQVMPFFLGKQAVDDITASLQRDYSKLASMAVVSADDFTMPVYFYVPDGKGWFTLTRGQCLIFLDVRSWRIIGYSLQPDRNYNSLVIRTLMNRVCRDHGIPGVWYFERGIWKRSLLVNGHAPTGWNDALSPTEVKTGWETFGVKFIYAKRARTKPIERVGGMLQDLMHGVRGYCGRDERRDCPEQTKRAIDDVQTRRVHPGELFLSFEEWGEQLSKFIEKYNASSQDGRVLEGMSPDDAFQRFWPESDPPAKLDERAWHLLAHYVRPIRVTSNGICFRVGQKQFVYRNERTGKDRGKEVLVWFDPESPDTVSVTDMDRKNPYIVERSSLVNFIAEKGDEQFERETSKIAAHGSHYRTLYRTLKAKFEPKFRRMGFVEPQTAATARAMQQQRDEHSAKERESNAARKSFSRLGMSTPRDLRSGQADAAKELATILDKNSSSLSTGANGEMVYQLKASGTDKTEYVNYLLSRLTEFRKIGGNYFGQKFNTAVTLGMTRNTAQAHLKCSVYDESRFNEICSYLKESIDKTIKGKNNAAKGFTNYHAFENHKEKAGKI